MRRTAPLGFCTRLSSRHSLLDNELTVSPLEVFIEHIPPWYLRHPSRYLSIFSIVLRSHPAMSRTPLLMKGKG